MHCLDHFDREASVPDLLNKSGRDRLGHYQHWMNISATQIGRIFK